MTPTERDALQGLVTQWQKGALKLSPGGWLQSIRRDQWLKCADELSALLAGVPEPPKDTNLIAVQLAEMLAAHRDGQDGSDCSDINDPGSCAKCDVLSSAIKRLSMGVPEVAAPGSQEPVRHLVMAMEEASRVPLPGATLTRRVEMVETVEGGERRFVPLPGATRFEPTGDPYLDHARLGLLDTQANRVPLPGAGASTKQLQARIDWLEGTAMPHARRQENANGFQKGWHAALSRISEGEDWAALSAIVPPPCADVNDTLPVGSRPRRGPRRSNPRAGTS